MTRLAHAPRRAAVFLVALVVALVPVLLTAAPASAAPAAPNRPTMSTTVTGGTGSLRFTWTAATVPAGSPAVNGYELTLTPSDATPPVVTTVGVVTNVTVTGLTDGTFYTATLKAQNTIGLSVPSIQVVKASPSPKPTVPLAITPVRAPDALSMTVTWSPPANAPGSAVTRYVVTTNTTNAAPVPASVTVNRAADGTIATAATVSGLSATGAYQVRVTAYSIAGTGTTSAYTNVPSPNTVPNRPTLSTTVTGGAGFLTYKWTAGTVPAAAPPITGYQLTLTPSDGSGSVVTSFGAVITGTVTGLADGKWYSATLQAQNSAGLSPASTQVVNASPSGIPTPAQSIVTTRAPDGLSGAVTWAAPANAPDSGVSRYVLTFRTLNGAAVPASITINRAANGTIATSAAVPVMAASGAYEVRITAYSIAGTGAVSAYVPFDSPLTVPNRPTMSTGVTGGSGWLKFTWTTGTVPAGGTPITGYELTLVPSDGSGNVVTTFGVGTTGTVTGLVDGKWYTATLRSINSAGLSLPSTAVVKASPAGIPTVPLNITTTRSGTATSGTVTWDPPANAPGSAVTRYVISFASSNGAPVPASITINRTAAGTTATTTNVNGLSNIGAYTARVLAYTIAGTGAWSAYVPIASPGAVPGTTSPTITVTTATSVTMTWPAATAGAGTPPVGGYRITATSAGNPDVVLDLGNVLTGTVTGLTTGTLYTFTVQAWNVNGYANPSPTPRAAAPSGLPTAVQNLAVTRNPADPTQATITWTPPANIVGASITRYVISFTSLNGAPAVGSLTVSRQPDGTTATTAVRTGLSAVGAYRITVTPYTGAGAGPGTNVNLTIATAVPGPPTGVTTTVVGPDINVTWTPPASGGNSPVDYYLVSWRMYGTTLWMQDFATSTSYVISGIDPGEAVEVSVGAGNTYGFGPLAVSSLTTIPVDVPLPMDDIPGHAAVIGSPVVNASGNITAATVAISVPGTVNTAGQIARVYQDAGGLTPTGGQLGTCTPAAGLTRCQATMPITGTGVNYVVRYTDTASGISTYFPVSLELVHQARLASVANHVWTALNATYVPWSTANGNKDFGQFIALADDDLNAREPLLAPKVFYASTTNGGTLNVTTGFAAWETAVLTASSVADQNGLALLPVSVETGALDTRLGQFTITLQNPDAAVSEYRGVGFLGNGYDPGRATDAGWPAAPVWRTKTVFYQYTPESWSANGYVAPRIDQAFALQATLTGTNLVEGQ